MMGLGPYRPSRDLERAIERGDLEMAVALAKDLAREVGQPVRLDLALRLLPLVAAEREAFDAWSCRWLARWLAETHGPTIDRAADVAGALAGLPEEPQALTTILGMLR
jgi:hypothetical protein